MNLPEKAKQPTFYFIGVTTSQSSIMSVFSHWAKELGLKDAVIKGIDIEIHDKEENYRKTVEFIKNDPLSLGALVTTHKLDIYKAASDMFDYLDLYAEKFRELSSISKRNGMLCGHAKDPITSGKALQTFIPKGFWEKNKGEVFIMGAGGSALSMCFHLTQDIFEEDVPSKIVIANRSEPRLKEAKDKLEGISKQTKFEYLLGPQADDNDSYMSNIKPYSLVVNATGLGKDRPGSPLTNNCKFPKNSLIWELNYRGNLVFLDQANEQKENRNLYIEDGWNYFIHGWLEVISEVFNVEITSEKLEKCSEIAMNLRKK